MRNPYTAGTPVSGKQFFGRHDILRSVQEALESSAQRVVVLHGQRRIGKTSILNELQKSLPSRGYHVVKFDLMRHVGRDLPEILSEFAKAIREALKLPNSYTPDNAARTLEWFENSFLPGVTRAVKGELLILIDEFDLPTEEGKLVVPREFTSLLERLVTREKTCVNLVLVAGSNLSSLPGHAQALCRYGTAVRVSFLSYGEAQQLIKQPVGDQLEYTAQAIDAILAVTGGHPYLTQLVCLEAFNLCQSSRLVRVEHIEEAAQKALNSGTGAIGWIWRELTLPERIYLAAAARYSQDGKSPVRDDDVRQILTEYGIRLLRVDLPSAALDLVERQFLTHGGPSSYSFTVDLLRQWVRRDQPLERARMIIEAAVPEARIEVNLGHEAHNRGHLREAIEHYRTAVNANPEYFRAQLSLARALYENESWEQAVRESEKAYDLDEPSARPGLIDALLALGEVYEQQKKLDEARAQYERALEISPKEKRAKSRLDRLGNGPGGLGSIFWRLIGRKP